MLIHPVTSHTYSFLLPALLLLSSLLSSVSRLLVGFAYAFQSCTAAIKLFQKGSMKSSVDEKRRDIGIQLCDRGNKG